MRRPYHGGQNAREWRRQVAALAARRKESVFTYKFGLDTKPGDIDFDAAARAYDITEGIEKGSLIALVCAVHLSGFRLFSKAGETHQFRNRNRYPASPFAAALQMHVGIENPKLTIQSIENVFETPPRARNGIVSSWSADNLALRLFRSWTGRAPRDGDSDSPTFALANRIAREVTAEFSGWKELAGNAPGALACADRHLASLGDSFPKLGGLPLPNTDIRPESCTFAYDAKSPFVDMDGNPPIWLHQTVAVCAGRLRRDGYDPSSSESEFALKLKNSVVTSKNNGLSWLFGNGLLYLRGADIERIAQDLSVPDCELRRVEQLKAFADAVPVNPFFDVDRYAEFRLSVGGKISSWVSNYWKRIRELDALHSQPPDIIIPEALHDAENASLFSGQHTGAAGLDVLSTRLLEQINGAGAALGTLRGDGIPCQEHINAVEQAAGNLTEFIGQINMLDNRIKQEIDRAKDKEDADRVGRLESLCQHLPDGLKELPKLNRISGGTADAAGEIERLEDSLNAAVRERRNHFRRLAAWADDNSMVLDPLPAMAERERKALADRGMDTTLADEKALRRLLHDIVGMSRRLSPDTAKLVRDAVAPLFLEKKKANRYIRNRQGAIYRHPFSTSRHQEYSIDIVRARRIDWSAWLDSQASDIRKKLNSDGGRPALLRDLLAIEGFVFTHRLGGLPDRVPSELARPQTEDGLVEVPPLLAAQFDADEVSRDAAVRAFNLFNGVINGLSFRAFRDDFIVRVKFQRDDHEELFYAPKGRAWRPPGDYLSAKGDISKGLLALPAVARDQAGAILPCETAQGLSGSGFPEPGSRALLRQAPHDWFVELDLRRGAAPDRAGLPVKKNMQGLKRWRSLKKPAFRLVGPPSFKTWLDRILVRKDVKLGDYTLILDRSYKQSLTVEDGEIRLTAEPTHVKAEIAVPVIDNRPYPEITGNLLFDKIAAIDLGEKRIGFAVFSLVELLENDVRDPMTGDDGKPIVGTVAVPAFRRLMAAVRRHRRSRQPNQKVGRTYSKALMQFRENVVGDVCNRIDTLCERFRAFPVLESSVGNFESGGRQLEMIYGSVLRRYTYSDVDAHKTARRHYWFTAEKWQHPYLSVHEWNTTTKTYSGRPKPLTVFPGVTVNPAGTSRTCHCCDRNALAALRDMPDRIDVNENGDIILGDGTVKLFERADYPLSELKQLRRRKERPPLNAPVQQGSRRRGDLEKIAKRNMRQSPLSVMSPDTAQSRFVCVYTDCGFEGHADENAAVNIGRRFLERIDIERSREARQALTANRE